MAELKDVAAAVCLLAERNRVIAEVPAPALWRGPVRPSGAGKIVCVVSGGNIDAMKLCTILARGSG